MYKQLLKINFILLSIFLFGFSTAFAQDAMTMLKFENAEKAFNSGNYEETLKQLDEVENVTGITSKTLYLRIVTQDQLNQNSLIPDAGLYESLKINVNQYLDALKNEEIDDKYRKVYKIGEDMNEFSPNQSSVEEQIRVFTNNIKDEKVRRVFHDYWKAVLGEVDPNRIKTTQTEFEYFREGEQSPFEKKASIKGLDKIYWRHEINQVPKYPNYTFTYEYKYANDKGIGITSVIGHPNGTPIEQTQKKEETRVMGIAPIKRTASPEISQQTPSVDQQRKQRELTPEEINTYRNSTKDGLSFLDARFAFMPVFDEQDALSAQYEEGEFNGESVAAIKITKEDKVGEDVKVTNRYLYFSLKNHLLLADKTITESAPLYNSSLLTYEDYKKERGLLLSFTRKNDFKYTQLKDRQKWDKEYKAASKKQRKEMDENLSKSRLLLNPKSSKDETYISKLKSVILNQPIPDEIFK